MAKEIKHLDEQGIRKLIRVLSGLSAAQQQIADQCVNEYNPDRTYQKDNILFYQGTLYRAKTVTQGNLPSPDSTYFEMLDGVENEITAQTIEDLMATTSAETWDYMKNFINDDIISGTHGYSSSKIYTEIQNAIQVAKDYTLEKIANSSTGSYVIATSTDEVVDDKHLFLISNGSNYDIYALVNGAPTKIGDTSVSLDGLLTEANAETTYLKQADATATYATITTTDALAAIVDEKVNKSSVLSSISNTPTTDQVYNAQIINTELAKKANAFNIHELADDSGKTKHLVIDIPSINSISGKTTRLFFSDNMKDEIGLQVWSADGILESDVRLSSKAIKQGDVAEVNWINCTTESNVSGMEVLIKNDDKTITDCGAFYAYKETTGGISYDINVLAKIGNIHLITPSDKSVYLNSKEICTKAVVDVPWTQLTMGSGMNGSMEYRVKNGICYVRVTAIACSTMSTRGQTITSGLPIPELTTNVWYSLAANSSTYGTLLINIDSTGKMINYIGVDNAQYCGFFSYPVAES